MKINGQLWGGGPLRNWEIEGDKGFMRPSKFSYENEFRTFPYPTNESPDLAFAILGDYGRGVRSRLKTFSELNEDLNEMNHKGFPVSFKEKVAFCSLQLSFAKKVENAQLASDIDIDLLTDIGHFGEVIKNKITKMKTDAFSIYVLLFDQGIRPLYTLKVK